MLDRTLAPLGRRLCDVVARRPLGAYFVLTVADEEGPVPQPGQFYMLAAAERWGGGEDERPYLPRATGWVGLFYLGAGAGLLAAPPAELGRAGWAVGLIFAAGQAATAAVLRRNRERESDA